MAPRIVFQILGTFALLYSGGLLLVSLVVPRARALFTTAIDYFRVALIIAALALIGAGLLRLKRWAAVALSLFLIYPAYWCLWAAIHPMQATGGDSSYWIGYVFALLLLCPACMTMFYWRSSIWKKGGEKGTA